MSGTKISLKKKKGPKKLLRKDDGSDYGDDDEEENNNLKSTKAQEITSFGKESQQKKPVQVKLQNVNHSLRPRARDASDKEDDCSEEDNEIDPDDFGACYLRALGWKGEDEETRPGRHEPKANNTTTHRQQGVALGIGAKAVSVDLAKELQSQIDIPVVKKSRKE
ncbi:uncharacterized protein LODBEIA_P20210 [Lodderomyces beijingensis]|uniref:Pre-mRNA-splicing factor SPP2 n=1 Tax=Lodderomyces beijingensis TaxID=1775926 RepID=A0ABP0ZI00_9ASCO